MSHSGPLPRVQGVNDLVTAYADLRPRLVRVAYGLLGDLAEAEDVVQEAWLRLQRADVDGDVEGWLVVTVSRLALDVLKSARRRREEYVGPWLPEPVVTAPDPADRVTLDESMSLAMHVVLESLSPAERTAFVLHEVFGLGFPEVAQAIRRTPAACRQLASRARRHVRQRAPRFEVDAAEHRKVVAAFATASQGLDLDGLLAVLDPGVVLLSDGGGRVSAARNPVCGADKVARFLVGVRQRFAAETTLAPATVNGRPGLLRHRGGEASAVFGFTVVDGRITEIGIVMNPEKLRSLA